MCEKGALWVEGSKPVSQEAASLPIIWKNPRTLTIHQGRVSQ